MARRKRAAAKSRVQGMVEAACLGTGWSERKFMEWAVEVAMAVGSGEAVRGLELQRQYRNALRMADAKRRAADVLREARRECEKPVMVKQLGRVLTPGTRHADIHALGPE